MVINAGALTHYISIRDAISAITLPCVEVHLSNIHAETFRHKSVIFSLFRPNSGFSVNSYVLGLRAIVDHLREVPVNRFVVFFQCFLLLSVGSTEELIQADRPKVRVRADATVQSPQIAVLKAGEVLKKWKKGRMV